MKNILISLIAAFTLQSCINSPISEKGDLPAITQTGANTVGCLLNGKVYLPSQGGMYTPGVNCFYQYDDGGYYFSIRFADEKNNGPQIAVQTRRINLQAGQTYVLNMNPVYAGSSVKGGGGYYSLHPDNILSTDSINTGELKITRVDPSHSIVSGTFWFDAVNAKGEKVEIRQGRFDWHYGM